MDCRVCKHHYKIWGGEYGEGEESLMVCTILKGVIAPEQIKEGDCEFYDDVDGNDTA